MSQGVGGLLGHDRVKPADLRRSGRRQLEEHANVEPRHGGVVDARPTGDGFVVTSTDGRTIATDADGRTNVAGVYAAGDAATVSIRRLEQPWELARTSSTARAQRASPGGSS